MSMRAIAVHWIDPATDEEGMVTTDINGTLQDARAYYGQDGWRLNIGDGAGGDRLVKVTLIEELPA